MKLFSVALLTLSVICSLVLDSTTVNAADFEYSYTRPDTSHAQKYIVDQANVRVRSEGDFVYWQPVAGAEFYSDVTPGEIIYRFDFQQKVKSIELFMRTTAFTWSYSMGECHLYYSLDGRNWTRIATADTPGSEGAYSIGAYKGDLVVDYPEIEGVKQIYLKAELLSYGEKAEIACNTAQHSRYSIKENNVTFSLKATYDKWIKGKSRTNTDYYTDDFEYVNFDGLLPGENSTFSVFINNPSGDSIKATLTFGLSVNGGPITPIGLRTFTIWDNGEDAPYYEYPAEVYVPETVEEDAFDGRLVLVLTDEKGEVLDTHSFKENMNPEALNKVGAIIGLILLKSGAYEM